jgi:hypothetical protein
MKPGTHNFTIYRGVEFGPKKFVFKDGAGTPVDLTGLEAKAVARKNVNGPEDINLAPEVTDAEAGEVTMAMPTDTVMTLPAGDFFWDMTFERVSDGGRIGPYVAGRLHVPTLNTRPAEP